MLLEFKTMTDQQIRRLVHDVYPEGCMINAKYHHPEQEDLDTAIAEEAEYFFLFLKKKFLPQERNTYYVLDVEGEWVSALRLTKMDDFYYLEALETSPKQRKMGYGARLLSETIQLLKRRGPLTIRDNVKKDNLASLATHRRCGFRIEQEEAINCLSGETKADCYGLIYQEN